MKLRQLNIYLISLLAFAFGINYSLYSWLNYDVLSLKGDSFIQARIIWGVTLVAIGVCMILLTLLKQKIMSWYKCWAVLAAIVFVMQLPMASLWYMMLMRDPLLALKGVVLHTLLIGLISMDYINSHKLDGAVKIEPIATFHDDELT